VVGSSIQALDEAGQMSTRERDRKAWNLPQAAARTIAREARENEDDTAESEPRERRAGPPAEGTE
jgi:hypothetical protein